MHKHQMFLKSFWPKNYSFQKFDIIFCKYHHIIFTWLKFKLYILATINSGCLPFVRVNPLGRALNNGKGFSKITKPTKRNGVYPLPIWFPVIVFGWWETGNWKVLQLVRKFPLFRSERKNSTISERNFRKITLPFDFKSKFPDFLAKW